MTELTTAVRHTADSAEQANRLALDTSTIAAQGRKVVDDRNLAQRSGSAAKEIKTLIGDSVLKIDHGSALADAAGRTMSDVVASVKRVTDVMAEISEANRQQAIGIEQVNVAMGRMDEMTQRNAALVEEAAAAAESLHAQAERLQQAVAAFKLP